MLIDLLLKTQEKREGNNSNWFSVGGSYFFHLPPCSDQLGGPTIHSYPIKNEGPLLWNSSQTE
jgi:hypothetical protein